MTERWVAFSLAWHGLFPTRTASRSRTLETGRWLPSATAATTAGPRWSSYAGEVGVAKDIGGHRNRASPRVRSAGEADESVGVAERPLITDGAMVDATIRRIA